MARKKTSSNSRARSVDPTPQGNGLSHAAAIAIAEDARSSQPSPLHFTAQPSLESIPARQSLIAIDRTRDGIEDKSKIINNNNEINADNNIGNSSSHVSHSRSTSTASSVNGQNLITPALPTPHATGSIRSESQLEKRYNARVIPGSIPNQHSVGIRRPSNSSGHLANLASGNLSSTLPRSIPQSLRNTVLDSSRIPALSQSPSPSSNQGDIDNHYIRNYDNRKQSIDIAGSVTASSILQVEPTEINRLVGEHLVQKRGSVNNSDIGTFDELSNSFASRASNQQSSINDSQVSPTFGSVSHNLLGGEVTRDIYAWHERNENPQRRRRNSLPDVRGTRDDGLTRASDLREPGVFRRHFLANQSSRRGVSASVVNNALTRNFIDFLALYGYYGGDVCPNPDVFDENEEYLDHLAEDMYSDVEPGVGSDEQSSLLQRKQSQSNVSGTSTKKAFFMVLKAFLGTGVLFLPKAFADGGILLSIVGILIIGFLTLHCMLILIETSKHAPGSFGDIGEHYYGEVMRNVLISSIAIAQAGFSCAYYIFIAENMKYVTISLSNCRITNDDIPDWFFIFIQFLIYVPLSWVRRIKYFSFTSLIADVFILIGLTYVLYYDVINLLDAGHPATDLKWINYDAFPLFIGTAMFAFEGICLILPIGQSMSHPEKFPKVLTVFTFFISAVFITVGFLGYLSFGNDVKTIIFHNLDNNSKVKQVIQLVYAMAIMLSFPLTAYPCIRITEHGLFGSLDGKTSKVVKWQKNVYRSFLMGCLAFVAYAGSKSLDKFVSLVGCFACIPLSFIYPALFHSNIAKNKWVKYKDYLIVIFGIIAMLYTTSITIQQWQADGEKPVFDPCPAKPPSDTFKNLLTKLL